MLNLCATKLININPVAIEEGNKREKEREREKKEENTDSDILSYTLPNCQKQFLNYMYNLSKSADTLIR